MLSVHSVTNAEQLKQLKEQYQYEECIYRREMQKMVEIPKPSDERLQVAAEYLTAVESLYGDQIPVWLREERLRLIQNDELRYHIKNKILIAGLQGALAGGIFGAGVAFFASLAPAGAAPGTAAAAHLGLTNPFVNAPIVHWATALGGGALTTHLGGSAAVGAGAAIGFTGGAAIAAGGAAVYLGAKYGENVNGVGAPPHNHRQYKRVKLLLEGDTFQQTKDPKDLAQVQKPCLLNKLVTELNERYAPGCKSEYTKNGWFGGVSAEKWAEICCVGGKSPKREGNSFITWWECNCHDEGCEYCENVLRNP